MSQHRYPPSSGVLLALAALAGGAMIGSCSDANAPSPDAVAAITLSVTNDSLLVDDSLQLVADLRDPSGHAATRTVAWTSSDTAVARVSGEGLVRGRDAGTVVVTARVDAVVASAQLRVRERVRTVSFDTTAITLGVGDTAVLHVSMVDPHGVAVDRPVRFTSSDTLVASVDSAARVAGRRSGAAHIVADVEGRSDTVAVTVGELALSISPAVDSIAVGDTLVLAARLPDGGAAPGVAWSSNSAAATVSDGVVVGRSDGIATITASSGTQSAHATIYVFPAPDRIAIDPVMAQLRVGDTGRVRASGRHSGGEPMQGGRMRWGSSDAGVATVDDSGRVVARAAGTTTIAAHSGAARAEMTIVVSGTRPTETAAMGSNLARPLVFAEGIGLTGRPVTVNGERDFAATGLRPFANEQLSVTAMPYFYIGNAPNCLGPDARYYYCQQGLNVWQAEWVDGSTGGPSPALIAWGENVTSHQWNTGSRIQVEVALTDATRRMSGYAMKSLSGSGHTEIVAATGARADTFPAIFTITPRLVIQKLDGAQGQPVATVLDTALVDGIGSSDEMGRFGVEVTRSGSVEYGYKLQLSARPPLPEGIARAGWYRIAFVLDPNTHVNGRTVAPNVVISGVAPDDASSETGGYRYAPQVSADGLASWVDIELTAMTPIDSTTGGNAVPPGPGNNLSWPVVFAEGIGMSGAPVEQSPGVRPAPAENVVADARPFFYSGNVPDTTILGVPYFVQNSTSIWQADWRNGSGSERRVRAAWPDSLMQVTFNAHQTMRIEVTLSDLDAGTLAGYDMLAVPGDTLQYGTDGHTSPFVPTVYTEAARLVIEKLNDADTTQTVLTLVDKGTWVHDALPIARVNAMGKITYVYNLKLLDIPTDRFGGNRKYGLWRFTFVLGGEGAPVTPNVRIDGVQSPAGFARYLPAASADGRSTSLTVWIDPGPPSGH